MYCNSFSTILYIISDNSLITLMKSGMTTKYWFVKIYLNLLPHLCCVSSMFYLSYKQHKGGISDMGIDGPTFVPKSGYFLRIWVKVCPQKLAFS